MLVYPRCKVCGVVMRRVSLRRALAVLVLPEELHARADDPPTWVCLTHLLVAVQRAS